MAGEEASKEVLWWETCSSGEGPRVSPQDPLYIGSRPQMLDYGKELNQEWIDEIILRAHFTKV